MKKGLLLGSLSLLAVLSLGFTKAQLLASKEEMNKKMIELLSSINDETTQVKVDFSALEFDATKTLNFAVGGRLLETGKENVIDLNVEEFNYAYGDGTQPVAHFKGYLALDFIKAFGQKDFNKYTSQAGDMVQEYAQDLLSEYGEAAILEVIENKMTSDENGNVQSVTVNFKVRIDMAKLPSDMDPADVDFSSFAFTAEVTPQKLTTDVTVGMNTLNKHYKTENLGFKEFAEQILAGDEDATREFVSNVEQLVSYAEYYSNHVEKK